VLSGDQLIDEVRLALLAETDGIDPRPGTLNRVRQELATSARPGWPRRRGVRADAMVITVTTAITIAVALIAIVFLHHNSSSSSTGQILVPAMNRVEVGTVRLTAQAADPNGGLRWGLRTIQTGGREACLQTGRVKGGVIGVVGQDGAYSDDGRFHLIPSRDNFPCAGTDANNYLFLNVLEQDVPAPPAKRSHEHLRRDIVTRLADPSAGVAPHCLPVPLEKRREKHGLLDGERQQLGVSGIGVHTRSTFDRTKSLADYAWFPDRITPGSRVTSTPFSLLPFTQSRFG
jgi:hypothetical protein